MFRRCNLLRKQNHRLGNTAAVLLVSFAGLYKQEGWLSPTERASAGSLRPWDHRCINVTWIEREFNAFSKAACTYLLTYFIYPSIFNRFPVIQAVQDSINLTRNCRRA